MEEALIKRVMPHSIEAEQSVVGAMLMDKDAITTAGEIISGDDFYQASYGVIFDSMIELFNEGKGRTGGDCQSGICQRPGDSSADFCEREILRTDRGR